MALEFQKMWDNHPSNKGENQPCKQADGTPAFENQCAIRLGLALAGAGMNMRVGKLAKCWFKGHGIHVLRAEELSVWLSLQLGAPTKFKPKKGENLESTVLTAITGKKGIVFCRDFWAPSPGGANVGDHIDLWDGTQMAHGYTNYFGPASQVWFWEVKV